MKIRIGFHRLGSVEEIQNQILANGAALAYVDAGSPEFEFYDGGVITGQDCGKSLDHSIVLMG